MSAGVGSNAVDKETRKTRPNITEEKGDTCGREREMERRERRANLLTNADVFYGEERRK